MGVIKRQVVKSNIVSFAGVLMGVFSHLFIYTMDMELKGYSDALIKFARLLMPFFILGSTSVMIRFLPYASQTREIAGRSLFTRALLVLAGSLLVGALLLLLLGKSGLATIDELLPFNLGYLITEPWLILVLLGLLAFAQILTANLTNHRRIAIPAIFNNFLPKILLPLLIYGVVSLGLGRGYYAAGLILIYFLAMLGLWAYSRRLGHHKFSLTPLGLNPERRRQMYSLAGFAVLGTLGSALATTIDTLYISSTLGDNATAVYSFAIYATTIMFIPSQAVNAICAPIVATAYQQKDTEQITFLYRESAKVLLAWGGIVYVGGLLCLPFIFALTRGTEQLAAAFTVFALLGAGQLFDLATSINTTIVSNSDHFRWNTVFILMLGLINIGLNYLFITVLQLGINGAAMATALSLFAFNIAKVILIWFKVGVQPISRSICLTIAVLAGVYLVASMLPLTDIPLLDLLLRGLTAALLYFVYLRFTNGVPPVRRFFLQGKDFLFKK